MARAQGLTKRKKLGYAFGIFSDSLYYNMFYTYYLTFLIEIVGIEPRYSSIIIFISILWDAVTDPLIGNYTDRPGVDKSKVMKRSLFPLALLFIVAWTSVGTLLPGQVLRLAFYTAVTMAVWLFYTYYCIPYYSVVAELTDDYDERTEIRSQSSLINAACVGFANILPALVPTVANLLGERFQSEAYAVIAAVMSLGGVITGFVCVKSLKGVYTPRTAPEGSIKNRGAAGMFRAFGSLFRLRPARLFMGYVLFFFIASSMIQSNITYCVIDCIGNSYDTGIVIFILSLVIFMALTVAVSEKVANKTDRRTACLIFLSIVVVGELAAKIIGLDLRIAGFPVMNVIVPGLLGIGTGSFWTFFYSMAYDLVELDEFRTGERRESVITALPQFVQKSGSAVGVLLAGQFLSLYGYDASGDIAGQESFFKVVTDPHIVNGMGNISTVFPAIGLIICLIFLAAYPMTRKRFESLKAALEKKRAGEEYDTKEFEKLLK